MEPKLADMNRKLETQSTDLQGAQRSLADMNAAAQKSQQAAAFDAQAAASRADACRGQGRQGLRAGPPEGRPVELTAATKGTASAFAPGPSPRSEPPSETSTGIPLPLLEGHLPACDCPRVGRRPRAVEQPLRLGC